MLMNFEALYDAMESIDKKYIFTYTLYDKKITKKYFATWKDYRRRAAQSSAQSTAQSSAQSSARDASF